MREEGGGAKSKLEREKIKDGDIFIERKNERKREI